MYVYTKLIISRLNSANTGYDLKYLHILFGIILWNLYFLIPLVFITYLIRQDRIITMQKIIIAHLA